MLQHGDLNPILHQWKVETIKEKLILDSQYVKHIIGQNENHPKPISLQQIF
jgi:hypothetical protein